MSDSKVKIFAKQTAGNVNVEKKLSSERMTELHQQKVGLTSQTYNVVRKKINNQREKAHQNMKSRYQNYVQKKIIFGSSYLTECSVNLGVIYFKKEIILFMQDSALVGSCFSNQHHCRLTCQVTLINKIVTSTVVVLFPLQAPLPEL